MWAHEIYEKSAVSPTFALFVVIGTVLGLGAGVVVGMLRARRRDMLARVAEASARDTPPILREGDDVVLCGIVRHHEDQTVAVKVSIRQAGTEQESSGSWSYSWTEIDREIVLAPFLLELANGELVFIAPPKTVDVADDLDQKVWIDRNHRILSAELVPGERIFARGRLARSDRAVPGGAYRDVAWGWALHPSDGQMLLSSEPLGQGLRQRAVFHRHHAWIAVALLALAVPTLIPYVQRLAGHTIVETVRGVDQWQTTDDDGDPVYHCAVDVHGHEIEISGSDVSRGDTVPIRVASETNWALGSRATITWWHAVILSIGVGGFWLAYRARRRSSRPWFRRKLKESGRGRLPDPPPA